MKTHDPETNYMSEQLVVLEDCGNYACITLNRPAKQNALNRAAQVQLQDILKQCVGRYAAVILTGAGSSFCAGVDADEARDWKESDGPAHGGASPHMLVAFPQSWMTRRSAGVN